MSQPVTCIDMREREHQQEYHSSLLSPATERPSVSLWSHPDSINQLNISLFSAGREVSGENIS